jgi:addiction module RelE/StbE family toxin
MEKTYKVQLTEIALENLEHIPAKHIKEILDRIAFLETFPEMGTSIQKEAWKGYRQLIVQWYRIVYTIDETSKTVYIHLVQHGKMYFQ